MAKMIYTTYQTNSCKIVKSTFSNYELPHMPVISSINFSIFTIVLKILTEQKSSDKLCSFTEHGGRLPSPRISATAHLRNIIVH